MKEYEWSSCREEQQSSNGGYKEEVVAQADRS
jgi:hypothetical protein